MRASISLPEARRIALAAQMSPGAERPPGNPGPAAIAKLVDRLNLLQIDSVNVVSRSHYLPVFSRLGVYDRAALDALTFARNRKRRLFEYWAHEASFLPMRLYPLLRWRMDAARRGEGVYGELTRFASEQKGYVEDVLAQIRSRGPLTVSKLTNPGNRTAHWWGWSAGKTALEYLFWVGDVTAATRRNFERIYDLPQHVIPADIYGATAVPRAEAIRELMRLSATALGIATFADLRDYFRLPLADARQALLELVENGDLITVGVDGWTGEAYVPKDQKLPRKPPQCSALLSPFDPLVWQRARAE
ncbi:MAG: winged helix DNA-binding domain-containing protein, partial [Pseudomonadota bacterium]|nr:winged helix DNA-binding domain-containing protein [Pseudomonadota bacterium]